MTGAVLDIEAERGRRARPAPALPPSTEPLLFAADVVEHYGLALFEYGVESGDGPDIDEDSEEAVVLARQIRRLGARLRPAPGTAPGRAPEDAG